jgi:hypothetical protein
MIRDWHNVSEQDLWSYARSFHAAAKKLAGAIELDPGPFTEFDACSVVYLYRHVVELQLKALILGAGGNFLANRPDPLSVSKSLSLSWLSQFLCQMVTALKWEDSFKCEGIETLADFRAVVEDINSVDPGPGAFRYPGEAQFNIREFAAKMDALLELLDSTADALEATWDMQMEGTAPEVEDGGGSDFGPTIQ